MLHIPGIKSNKYRLIDQEELQGGEKLQDDESIISK